MLLAKVDPGAGWTVEKGDTRAGRDPVREAARAEAGGWSGRARAAVRGDWAAEGGTGLAEKKVRAEPVIARRTWFE